MREWLIVGGGIHGTYPANVLTQQAHLTVEQVGIRDPARNCRPPETA